MGGVSSSCLDIACGVPQRSVLGPKLFILYIDDICKVLKLVLFAVDTNIFCAQDSLDIISHISLIVLRFGAITIKVQ